MNSNDFYFKFVKNLKSCQSKIEVWSLAEKFSSAWLWITVNALQCWWVHEGHEIKIAQITFDGWSVTKGLKVYLSVTKLSDWKVSKNN